MMDKSFFFVLIITISSTRGLGWGSFDLFGAGSYIAKTVKVNLNIESCDENWIIQDYEGLQSDFEERVFGQPFLQRSLLPILRKRFDEKTFSGGDSRKPLVLSFHGSPGTGKNYVAELIAKNYYRKGAHSQYYNFMSGRKDFTHDRKLENYQAFLQKLIKDSVRRCEKSIFVFDEIDKMPEGILDAIKPFLDFYPNIDGLNFRESIFIFISNTGSGLINHKATELWKEGIRREEYSWSDFHHMLFKTAYNENGGLKKTSVVQNALVDLYLPFLPLEKDHIKQCAKFEANKLNLQLSDNQLKEILNDLVFIPEDSPAFSASGCKSVENAVVIVTQSYYRKIEL